MRQAVARTFIEGPGAPLLFLWVVGAGTLLALFHMPVPALLLTAVFAVIGVGMVRECLATPERRREMVRHVVGRHVAGPELPEGGLREAVRKATDVVVELTVKVLDLGARASDDDLGRVADDARAMLALQFESACRVAEYRRVLALIEPSVSAGHAVPGPEPDLRARNLATVERCAVADEALVADIGRQLETLTLQVLQMERRTSDVVRAAQFAEETNERLRSLQAVVTARRDTAEAICRMVSTRTD